MNLPGQEAKVIMGKPIIAGTRITVELTHDAILVALQCAVHERAVNQSGGANAYR